MRLAWTGPTPNVDGGGTSGVATQLLSGLARLGVEIDVYLTSPPEDVPECLRSEPGLHFTHVEHGWEWNRWYSRTPLTQFATGQAARIAAQVRLARIVAERHERRRYDFLYQFAQIELFALRALRRRLPPIVMHPGTHAQGELTGLRNEAAMARRFDSSWRLAAVRAMMTSRAAVQRSDIGLAELVIAISPRFGRHLVEDYGVAPERVAVVPNPIDLELFTPSGDGDRLGPQRLLFVSRLAVRKGLEMITALSHGLDDHAGEVVIEIAGGPSLWSDYSALLGDLNPSTARYVGSLARSRLAEKLATTAGLLQPSHFEPFGLTVGEALAAGSPVVASDEVGAVEGVDPRVCLTFPAGSQDRFEQEVRRLLRARADGQAGGLAELARSEAVRLFDPEKVAGDLLDHLAARTPRRKATDRAASVA
jgi:glycosyltransferase involved in cell wall biosynthesis